MSLNVPLIQINQEINRAKVDIVGSTNNCKLKTSSAPTNRFYIIYHRGGGWPFKAFVFHTSEFNITSKLIKKKYFRPTIP